MADQKGIKRSSYVKLTDQDEEQVSKIGQKSTGEYAQHVIAEIRAQNGNIDTSPYLVNYAIDSDRNNNTFNSEEVMWSYTGSGKFLSFWGEMNDKDYIYRMYVDGVLVVDTDMRLFKDAGVNKDHSPLGQMDLFYEDGDKTMGHFPKYPLAFFTSVEIRMQGIGGSNTLKSYVVSLTKET